MRKLANLVSVLTMLISLNVATAYAEQPALATLNAQFETTECALPCKKSIKTNWWMWRTPTQVELKKSNAANSELWTMQDNNQLNYQFLMHDEKRVIEYSSIDLKMLNMPADAEKWQALNSLVTQKDLASMKKTKLKKQYQGLDLTTYAGKINGIKTNITWIDALQIPLQMIYVYPKTKITIQLLKRDTTDLVAGATTAAQLQGYQQVDYADIGDMEHSSTAKVWLSNATDAPGMHTHGHQH